jgi:hypothetical protein
MVGPTLALLAALFNTAVSRAQTVSNPNLTVTPVLPLFTLAQPTSMEFVGPDDFLVLEKDTGIAMVGLSTHSARRRSATASTAIPGTRAVR